MIELILAAALAQATPAPDPCHVGPPEAAPARCPRWRQIQLVRAITDASGYIDPTSVRRAGNAVELTTLTVLRTPMQGNVSRFIIRARFDCAARTTTALHVTAFDPAGVKVHDAPVVGDTPEPTPAGSPRAALMDEFCPR